MNAMRAGLAIVCLLVLEACAPQPLFQPSVMQDVDDHFDFAAWRATPTKGVGQKVQLGGRIVQAETTEDGVMIVAVQLPIVKSPAYGPTDPGKRPGAFGFAFLYPGKIESSALELGNRFIVVGTTQAPKGVIVDGARVSQPFLVARCVHIWKTQGREISDFPSVGAGYEALEENTYCAAVLEPAAR